MKISRCSVLKPGSGGRASRIGHLPRSARPLLRNSRCSLALAAFGQRSQKTRSGRPGQKAWPLSIREALPPLPSYLRCFGCGDSLVSLSSMVGFDGEKKHLLLNSLIALPDSASTCQERKKLKPLRSTAIASSLAQNRAPASGGSSRQIRTRFSPPAGQGFSASTV